VPPRCSYTISGGPDPCRLADAAAAPAENGARGPAVWYWNGSSWGIRELPSIDASSRGEPLDERGWWAEDGREEL
jgi:hypothetical protein